MSKRKAAFVGNFYNISKILDFVNQTSMTLFVLLTSNALLISGEIVRSVIKNSLDSFVVDILLLMVC